MLTQLRSSSDPILTQRAVDSDTKPGPILIQFRCSSRLIPDSDSSQIQRRLCSDSLQVQFRRNADSKVGPKPDAVQPQPNSGSSQIQPGQIEIQIRFSPGPNQTQLRPKADPVPAQCRFNSGPPQDRLRSNADSTPVRLPPKSRSSNSLQT